MAGCAVRHETHMVTAMPDDIRNNAAQHRFELDADGHTAVAYYTLSPGVITFTHTEVPPELGGRGIGSKLVRGALEAAPRPGPQGRGKVLLRLGLHRASMPSSPTWCCAVRCGR